MTNDLYKKMRKKTKSIDIVQERKYIGYFLLVLATFTAYDLCADYILGIPLIHILQEFLIFFMASFIIFFLKLRSRWQKEELTELEAKSNAIAQKYDKSQKDYLRLSGHFSDIVETMFNEWKLTKAEKDIANYLLKGCSMIEISDYRGTSERTVRQQAQLIYRKANVTSRKELTSSFIEDLLH